MNAKFNITLIEFMFSSLVYYIKHTACNMATMLKNIIRTYIPANKSYRCAKNVFSPSVFVFV